MLLGISAKNSLPNRKMHEEIKFTLHKAVKMPSPHCSVLLQVFYWAQWLEGISQCPNAAMRFVWEVKGLKNKDRLYEKKRKRSYWNQWETKEKQWRSKQNLSSLARRTKGFLPCSWFCAAVRRAEQARLPLIHPKWWVSHSDKEALEATVLLFHLCKEQNADKLKRPWQAAPTCTTKWASNPASYCRIQHSNRNNSLFM